jgi:hypothetical protein
MADCPNCGRHTLRTKDWACQWCGYPLISKSYKVIDKTFKELEEERNLALKPTGSEDETGLVTEYQPEVEQQAEPPIKPVSIPRPATVPPPQAQPSAATPPIAEPPPPEQQSAMSSPAIEPPSEVQPSAVPPPAPEPPPQAQDNAVPPPASEPAPEPVPPIASPPPPPIQSEPAPEPIYPPMPPPAAKPKIIVEPEPLPEPTIKLEDIQDGMEITAEQIDALFRTDKERANSKLAEKTLVIRGVVEKVFVKDQLDIRYVMVTSAQKKMTWGLRCTFNKEGASQVARLQEGEAVAVQGKYEGYSKNIIFKDCVLVQ